MKIILTPENIIGIILNIIALIDMCFIFTLFKEKWWKSLIPFYNIYILYKHTWNNKYICFIEIISLLLNSKFLSFIRKDIFISIYECIKALIEQESFYLDLNYGKIFIFLIFYIITYLIVFIFKRITYWKLCSKMQLNIFLKILTFIVPDICLLIDYFVYKGGIKNGKVSEYIG